MQKKSREQKDFDQQLGLYIKKRRLKLGLSQAELASRIGNNAQNISSLERGEVSPTLFFLHNLSIALGSDLITFLRSYKFPRKEK